LPTQSGISTGRAEVLRTLLCSGSSGFSALRRGAGPTDYGRQGGLREAVAAIVAELRIRVIEFLATGANGGLAERLAALAAELRVGIGQGVAFMTAHLGLA